MAVYTDSPDFAAQLLPGSTRWRPPRPAGGELDRWLGRFLGPGALEGTGAPAPWRHLVLARRSPRSNYDRLIEAIRAGDRLPDRLVCVAGEGRGFHGYRGRPWAAEPGNLHVSVHLAPCRPVERFEVAFTVLAALSVVEAVDRVPGLSGRAGIRWVNDILLDGAKVAGVLAYTHAQGTVVNAAVMGIGVNIDTRPTVEPTPFVPAVTCLREHTSPAPDLRASFLAELLAALDRNYDRLLCEGHRPLVAAYRSRSVVLDRPVTLCTEDSDTVPEVLGRGTVRALGEGLELYLDGRARPVTRGRIILDEPIVGRKAV